MRFSGLAIKSRVLRFMDSNWWGTGVANRGGIMPTDFREWGLLRITFFRILTNFLLAGYYRKFIDGLNLVGDENVLELGSGTGAASKHLAGALQNGGRLLCTDISAPLQNAARRATADYANVEFKLGDVASMALPAASMDLVFIHFVLHDIPAAGRKTVLQALRRVLKPNGQLVIREPIGLSHGMPIAEIERLLKETGFKPLKSYAGKVSFWRPRAYTGLFV
jgi:ubiquinone/menaquinone biosynthesis C-methylase UbiE